ncbi:MAG: nitrilase-related carbon-nitrogen hydrolase, partial [Fidelibacterota bacterium]
MKIALCQINPTVGAFEINQKLILMYYKKSIEANADIVVFPELSIPGYPPQDLLWESGF